MDPRLILAIVFKESRDLANAPGYQEIQVRFTSLYNKLDDDGASIGVANVKESTYQDVMERHGSAFADRGSWESLKDDDDLSIHVLAWHLADTLDSLKVAPTHLRGVTPDEAAAVEHQTGLWTRPAPPKDPLSQKQIGDAMKHLDVMAPRFERADWIICGSGVWTC